jgi:tetratricopeptide (TPR) repeat protein
MKSYHRLNNLKDKFYNFCFKDSVVLTKVSRRRMRFYLVLGIIGIFGLSIYLTLPKQSLKQPMVIEPVVHIQKEPINSMPKQPVMPLASSIQKMEASKKKAEPVVEKTIEEAPAVVEKPVEVKKEEVIQEKPKSSIERVSKGDNELDALYQKAISFVKQKKFAQARAILGRDDIIRYSHGKALTMFVKILLNERSYDLIETYAKKYIDLYPSEKKDVLIAYGYALSANGKNQELIKAFGQNVPSENVKEYYKLLGQAHLKQKNYIQAREIYERLLQNDDNNTKLLMALLISQIGLKDMDAAQITMGKLYQQPLDPRESQALKKMGKLVVTSE